MTTLPLPSALTMDTVEEFAAELAAMPADQLLSVEIDAAALETLTTPGIQLLVSLSKSVAHHQGMLAIHHLSPSMQQVCEQAGISALVAEWGMQQGNAFVSKGASHE